MASRVSEFLDLDRDYLSSRQDRRDSWALGKIYDSATGLFGLIRPKTDRAVIASFPQGGKLHESVAVRLAAGTQLFGGAYTPPSLPGALPPGSTVPLGGLEEQLRWSAREPAHASTSNRPEPVLFDRILRKLGGG